jgi:hypothetical protein
MIARRVNKLRYLEGQGSAPIGPLGDRGVARAVAPRPVAVSPRAQDDGKPFRVSARRCRRSPGGRAAPPAQRRRPKDSSCCCSGQPAGLADVLAIREAPAADRRSCSRTRHIRHDRRREAIRRKRGAGGEHAAPAIAHAGPCSFTAAIRSSGAK